MMDCKKKSSRKIKVAPYIEKFYLERIFKLKNKNGEEIIGYIKFVDKKYINDFYNLKSLRLSMLDCFTKVENDDNNSDLINDDTEGRINNISIDNPGFISCFTELTKNNFDRKGIINHSISEALINSEEKIGNNRRFLFIPSRHMEDLIEHIKSYNENKIGELSETEIFSRKINYISNFNSEMKRYEKDLFDEKTPLKTRKKNFFERTLTKDSKYEKQQEYRIGIFLPISKKQFKEVYGDALGIKLEFNPAINNFATNDFPRNNLNNISIKKLQSLKVNEEIHKI